MLLLVVEGVPSAVSCESLPCVSHAGLFSQLPQSLVFQYLLASGSTSTNEKSWILSAHWSQSRRGLAIRLL